MQIQGFRKLKESESVNGGMVGRIETTYKELVHAFGEPHRLNSPDSKVQAEWRFFVEVNGGTMMVTIYDYKEDRAKEKVTDWHIGGSGKQHCQEEWVKRMMEINK